MTAGAAAPLANALARFTRAVRLRARFAFGLSCMTPVIQLTYPDGWQDFHLLWAAMALAIMAFGPGALSLDRLLGLDGFPPGRAPD